MAFILSSPEARFSDTELLLQLSNDFCYSENIFRSTAILINCPFYVFMNGELTLFSASLLPHKNTIKNLNIRSRILVIQGNLFSMQVLSITFKVINVTNINQLPSLSPEVWLKIIKPNVRLMHLFNKPLNHFEILFHILLNIIQ